MVVKFEDLSEDFSERSGGCEYTGVMDATVVGTSRPESQKNPTVMKNGDEKREEWSERSVGLLLELYEEKYFDMGKGNLRSKDWEQLVDRFNLEEAGGRKSVKQCRDKMDSLKKRHKLERAKKAIAGGVENCTWRWFNKMDGLFGNNNNPKLTIPGDAAEEAMDTKCSMTELEINLMEEDASPRMVKSWKDAKKLLKELPLSAQERGKARTLLLEKKEDERLEYFDGEDLEEITFCLKLLVERSSADSSVSAELIEMNYMMATGMQQRLEEILTDVITLKRHASSDLSFVATSKRERE